MRTLEPRSKSRINELISSILKNGRAKIILVLIVLLSAYYTLRHERSVPEVGYFILFTVVVFSVGLLLLIVRSSESDYKSYIKAVKDGTKIPEDTALMRSIIAFTVGFIIFMIIMATVYAVWNVYIRS